MLNAMQQKQPATFSSWHNQLLICYLLAFCFCAFALYAFLCCHVFVVLILFDLSTVAYAGE